LLRLESLIINHFALRSRLKLLIINSTFASGKLKFISLIAQAQFMSLFV